MTLVRDNLSCSPYLSRQALGDPRHGRCNGGSRGRIGEMASSEAPRDCRIGGDGCGGLLVRRCANRLHLRPRLWPRPGWSGSTRSSWRGARAHRSRAPMTRRRRSPIPGWTARGWRCRSTTPSPAVGRRRSRFCATAPAEPGPDRWCSTPADRAAQVWPSPRASHPPSAAARSTSSGSTRAGSGRARRRCTALRRMRSARSGPRTTRHWTSRSPRPRPATSSTSARSARAAGTCWPTSAPATWPGISTCSGPRSATGS